MELTTKIIQLSTMGHSHIYNITEEVQDVIRQEQILEGQVVVFGIGSTTGISTLEFEPGLVDHDIKEMLDKIAPYNVPYEHNKTWGDDNGASHLRSFLVKTSLTIPFIDGALLLGTWQQIVFADFDTRSRNRKLVVQITGNKSAK